MPNCVQEVRFSEPDPAIEKQGVECSAGRLSGSNSGGMGQPVGASNNEAVKRVFRVEAEALGARARCR